MDFEWDEAKSARSERERGLPFRVAVGLFKNPILEKDDTRRDYGERRVIAIGRLAGECFICVYTWRGTPERPIRRIISLRRAKRKERDAYDQAYPGQR